MTKLLLRLFIKNPEDYAHPTVRSAVGRLSGFVGIVCNLLLFAAKLFIGLLAGAVSIVADAMNNLADAASSIVTLIGFKLASQPADEEHPYGHARFEYLSGLAVAVLIIVIGFELAKSSLEKIVTPAPVSVSPVLVITLLLSVGVKLWLSLFNAKLGRRIDSKTLLATAADSRNDVITTTVVLLAAVLEAFTGWKVDGWFGMAVSLFILYSGWNLVKETVSPLLGEGASPELRGRIVDYIEANPNVLGYHDLMVHDYGPGRRFASLHVEMDSRVDPLECHEIIDDMERECMENHNVHLVIHYDPIVVDDPERTRVLTLVQDILQQLDSRLKVHDFRMSPTTGFTNLIFDVELPMDSVEQKSDIRCYLAEELARREDREYRLVITFDLAI